MAVLMLIIMTFICVCTGITKYGVPFWVGATEIILVIVCFTLLLGLISTDGAKQELEFYTKQNVLIEQKIKQKIKHSSDDENTIQELYKEHQYCKKKISERKSDQKNHEYVKWLLYFGKD